MDFLNKRIKRSCLILSLLILIVGCNKENTLSHNSFLNNKEANFDGAKIYVLHQRQIKELEAISKNDSFNSVNHHIGMINKLIDTPLVDIHSAQIQQLQTVMKSNQYNQPGWNAVVKEALSSLAESKSSGATLRTKYQLKQYIIDNKTAIMDAFKIQQQHLAYDAFVRLAITVDIDADGHFDLPILNNSNDRIVTIVDMTQVRNARYQAIIFETNESNINIKSLNANNTQQINKTVQEIATNLALRI
ncbi:hypothetical protein [Photobacterium andalusiense]|uniref:Lipoprotein n=1 Tax=Photobacterium andalusiense TaxID=2204296 RepID=A0A1Y6MBW1_9GAMM|nr:hypothetical protein [Photobacterium andalusiense]SMY33409.1 hypothetical protein PAND9192_00915 [Photobacterium andalusiense]